MTAPLLQLSNIHAAYGELPILKGVELTINEGELAALMGPNGAGKSTVLKAIVGLVRITSGEVAFDGSPITPRTEKMAGMGISYVPQGRQIFSSLSVEQNLELGGYSLPSHKEAVARLEVAFDIFPFLKDIRTKRAGALSGGQQQMLAVARGLMPRPKLLLLDEPTLGLSPKMVSEMFAKVSEINQRLGMAVCVVEHNIKTLLHLVDRATILDHGEVFACGTPDELEQADTLSRVFLAH
jgi:branched-chain amino acid transport system ATP-binding protein